MRVDILAVLFFGFCLRASFTPYQYILVFLYAKVTLMPAYYERVKEACKAHYLSKYTHKLHITYNFPQILASGGPPGALRRSLAGVAPSLRLAVRSRFTNRKAEYDRGCGVVL